MKYRLVLVYFITATLSVTAGKKITGLGNYNLPPFRVTEEKERFWDRVTIGGNVGLQFGTYTNIILSPAIGYIPKSKYLKDKLMVGVGITYMYSRTKYYGINYESNIYGGRTFIRYIIFQNFFAYAEDELLNAPVFINSNGDRQWVNSVFLGGGYLLQLTKKGGIMISVLYNLSWTPIHPLYSSPWNIRVGFML